MKQVQFRPGTIVAAIMAAALAGTMGFAAYAQDDAADEAAHGDEMAGEEMELAGWEVWQEGGCFGCHGDMADGGGDAANALGPNLRTTRLETEDLFETIACGRPGTNMPSFLMGAWTEYACFGDETVDEVPADVAAIGQFDEAQIQALVEFLDEHVVGVRRITRENCAEFFGGDETARACLAF